MSIAVRCRAPALPGDGLAAAGRHGSFASIIRAPQTQHQDWAHPGHICPAEACPRTGISPSLGLVAVVPDLQLDGSLPPQVQSAAPSDAEGQDDIPDGHMATPAGVVEASSDESNSGVDSDSASGIVAHRELAQAPDSKQSSSGALPGA